MGKFDQQYGACKDLGKQAGSKVGMLERTLHQHKDGQDCGGAVCACVCATATAAHSQGTPGLRREICMEIFPQFPVLLLTRCPWAGHFLPGPQFAHL